MPSTSMGVSTNFLPSRRSAMGCKDTTQLPSTSPTSVALTAKASLSTTALLRKKAQWCCCSTNSNKDSQKHKSWDIVTSGAATAANGRSGVLASTLSKNIKTSHNGIFKENHTTPGNHAHSDNGCLFPLGTQKQGSAS